MKQSASSIMRRMIYAAQESALRRPTFDYLKELEHSQSLTRKQLENLQTQKLARLLAIANAHCPWHRERLAEAGLGEVTESSEVSLADLARVPTMDRADAQLHGEKMRWESAPGGAEFYNTGGSSGQPLRFMFGRMRQASDAAGRMRARRWWGVEMGEPEVYLWGAPVELNKTDVIKTFRDRLLNQLMLNAFEMSHSNMDNYLSAIGRFDPVCIYGYASSMTLLASRALRTGRVPKLSRLKVICTTGEPLLPHQRDVIKEAFSAPIANEFGSRDIGFTAHESPSGQMLLMSESIILEVLDRSGNPVQAGKVGEAVLTGLCSDVQPFIRYRTGDMLSLSQDRCASGRGLHVIGEISGRSTDFVMKCDGTLMHALSVIYIIRAVEGVGEFKIIQHEIDHLEVQIVVNDLWQDSVKSEIVSAFRSRLGKSVRVEILVVDAIPTEASGKHRHVISRVAPPA